MLLAGLFDSLLNICLRVLKPGDVPFDAFLEDVKHSFVGGINRKLVKVILCQVADGVDGREGALDKVKFFVRHDVFLRYSVAIRKPI